MIDSAIKARAKNHGGTFSALVYLVSLFVTLGFLASIVYTLMQPTLIPNVGWTGHRAALPPNLSVLYGPDASLEQMEQAAVGAAETENRTQGIKPLFVFRPLRIEDRQSQFPLSAQKLTNLRTEP